MVRCGTEDERYDQIKRALADFYPIQVGSFTLETGANEGKAVDVISIIGSNMIDFIAAKLIRPTESVEDGWLRDAQGRKQENVWAEFDSAEWTEAWASGTEIIQARYRRDREKSCVHVSVVLNHERVGGGDYLELGAAMFNGTTNALLKVEQTLRTRIQSGLAMVGFVVEFLRIISMRSAAPRNREKIILANKFNVGMTLKRRADDVESTGVKTKVKLIYRILNNISSAMDWTRVPSGSLLVNIPMGFVKTDHCPSNNIGTLLFEFRRDMTLLEVDKALKRRMWTLMGSHAAIAGGSGSPDNAGDTSQHIPQADERPSGVDGSVPLLTSMANLFKQRIDVTITAANVQPDGQKLDTCLLPKLEFAHGGMSSMMDRDVIYPVYVWALTAGDVCFESFSIADERVDVSKLNGLLAGDSAAAGVQDVTNHQIYFHRKGTSCYVPLAAGFMSVLSQLVAQVCARRRILVGDWASTRHPRQE